MAITRFNDGSSFTSLKKYDSFLAGNFIGGDYESIQTATIGAGGSSTVTFSSIPSTYSHLQIRAISRSTSTNQFDNAMLTFNGDTSANYAQHQLYGNGTNPVVTDSTINRTNLESIFSTASTAIANNFGFGIMDILDYANTNKNKTTRTFTGFDKNGTGGFIVLRSGLWRSTAAVTSITLTNSTNNFAQYSSFALYGIK
jgi:hypothetical protein